jgi:hypothetical protein
VTTADLTAFGSRLYEAHASQQAVSPLGGHILTQNLTFTTRQGAAIVRPVDS